MVRSSTNPEAEYVQANESDIGLDRSNITSQGQIQLPSLDNDEDEDVRADNDRRSSSGMVNALKERKYHAAIKIRKKLHLQQKSDDLDPHTPILANATEEESDSRLAEKLPVPDKHTLKDFLHNPIDTTKSKLSNQGNQQVAGNIASKEIPHGQEVDLIKAHDAINHATTEHEREDAEQNEAQKIKARQSTLVRWSLDRHVTKVRLLPRETMVRKPRRDFQHKNPQGELVTDWKSYRQHVSH
ncbi:hypothetical protein IQ07DRAFT_661399 [Pyrenochaeta sp. DS3sAY3a]|nr:hypothetical protein IQ07DRAFT_661399 [Pyrenochaeta sp. DS3sAY3a]